MKTFLITIVLLFISFTYTYSQITAEYPNLEYAVVDTSHLLLDIYLPKSVQKPCPTVVWIHGGAWVIGDKLPLPYQCELLLNHGYAIVSINYRLAEIECFPAQIYDCKSAIRWLRAKSKQYYLETEKIGVWGESAGGHLAALLGTTNGVDSLEGDIGDNLQYSSKVQAVCDWYGPSDFTQTYTIAPILDEVLSLFLCGKAGNSYVKAEAASPVKYITPDDPPFIIMHGTTDSIVPYNQSVILDSMLKAEGLYSKLYTVIGGGHGWSDRVADSLIGYIYDFFDKYIKTPFTDVAINIPGSQSKITISPNPVSDVAEIRFYNHNYGNVSLKMYDVLGNEVMKIFEGYKNPGESKFRMNTSILNRGVYFLKMETKGLIETEKVVVW